VKAERRYFNLNSFRGIQDGGSGGYFDRETINFELKHISHNNQTFPKLRACDSVELTDFEALTALNALRIVD
jgi:hypothetical protein